MCLSDNEIIEILKEYENNPKKKYAILLDGDWGCGKTYFIKNGYIKKEDTNKLYISLYGIKNKDELNKKIYYTIIDNFLKNSKHKKIIDKVVEKVKIVVKNVSEFVKPSVITVENIFNINISKMKDVDISGIIALFKDIKKYILVFDDLERCDIPVNEVLGYINEYVEHKNVKVLIIANENEINKLNYDINYELKVMSCLNEEIDFEDNEYKINTLDTNKNNKITIDKLKNRVEWLYEENKKYKVIKEKLVGFTIKYEPDISNVYDKMIEEYEDKNKKLYEFLKKYKRAFIDIMKVNQCKNIRTMVYILDIFETLYNKGQKIINSERIMELVYRNTIFCAIGLKNGIKVEKILAGCMCNVSVSLYDDKSYNVKSYFTAFDFVNDYIVTGKLEEAKILKSVNYYKELKFDDLEKDDPFYDLQTYWKLEDEEIENALLKTKYNVKNEVYNYRLFPKLLYYLARIEKLDFKIELINEIIEEMKNKLEGKKIEYIDFHEFIDDEAIVKIYNKRVKEIEEKISLTNEIEAEKTVETALIAKDWGIELYEYVKENTRIYFDKKAFLQDFNIEVIINRIKESNTENIYYFKYCFDKIYRISNVKENYIKDVENLKVLIEGIEQLEKSQFGVTKKEVIEYLTKILKEILERLVK